MLMRARFTRLLCCCSLLVVAFAAPADAITIVDVTGSGDAGVIIGAGEAAAISFTLTQEVTNLSISAPVTCIGCSGGVWLHQSTIGSGASFGDTLEAEAFDATTTTDPFFSGQTLAPNLYFLIISIDSGSAAWIGSTVPTVSEPQGTRGLDFFATDAQAFAPLSDFSALLGQGALHFTVEGVPEPATLVLVGGGLLGLAVGRRRRKG